MSAEPTSPQELLSEPLDAAHPSLPGSDYHAPEIFERERDRIFYNKWVCLGRDEEIPNAGDFIVREILDESIVVVRDGKGGVNAFYNVCRHRGSRLCDSERGNAKGGIRCPYHAWTYTLDGRLRGTPNAEEIPGFQKADYPLYSVPIECWNGFVFVNLAKDPQPFSEQVHSWISRFEHYDLDKLKTGHSIRYEVAANWKIVIENWCECLHCPVVHPELVEIIPLYTRGSSVEDDGGWGNRMGPGMNTITRTGRSKLPPLPKLSEEDKSIYYGYTFFPNMIVNLSSDHAMIYRMEAVSPERTIVHSDFLFEEATVQASDFDPSEIVEMWDLVSRQDWAVCELTQKGVKSRAFEAGILTANDAYVYDFNRTYLQERDGA